MPTSPPAAERPAGPDHDLGPLAWVREELRKTLDTAGKALRRHLRQAEAGAPDSGHLAQARALLHQGTGVLAMVEQPAAAHMVRAMAAALQRFAEQPASCTDEAVTQLERAGDALNDYLDAVLTGHPVSAVALFPQYREVQGVAGNDRVHPADLWAADWHWIDAPLPGPVAPLALQPAVRSQFDQAVLKIVKTGDAAAASELQLVSLGLAAGAMDTPQRAFWGLAAAYFQAVAIGGVPSDLYAKRMASRVLTQYAALARGESMPAERLAQDLLFYCARVPAGTAAEADTLQAVRTAYGVGADVDVAAPLDYEARRFGRFDPAQLVQARKRLAAAADGWSALAGGDLHAGRSVLEQFMAAAESLARLHPDSVVLTQALQRAVEATVQGAAVPAPALALEVATAVLYLQAAYTALDEDDAGMRGRASQLAERLDAAAAGAPATPPPPWMEALHRRVSDRQTMGSVVAELRHALAEVEQTLDQFFRAPREKLVLGKAAVRLQQMRGVLAMLGMDEAARAVRQVGQTVDGYLADAPDDAAARAADFDRLGSSLSALGAFIDMLGYQRTQAGARFVYDPAQGLLRRVTAPIGTLAPEVPAEPTEPTGADAPADAQGTPLAHAADAAGPEAAPAAGEAAVSQGDAADPHDAPMPQAGPQRIDAAPYSAFLHEADDASRQLLATLGAWPDEGARPAAAGAVALAHVLARGAAHAGVDALAQLAGTLEQALQQAHEQGLPAGGLRVLLDAAEDIRQLLHQFAAGFLKSPSAPVAQALRALVQAQDAAALRAAFDDELDLVDAIDPDLFAVFDEEATELLPQLSAALRAWSTRPDDDDARNTTRRALHTLKGSARLAGALRLGELAHRLETAIEPLNRDGVPAAQIEPLLAHGDALQAHMAALRAARQAGAAPAGDPASGPALSPPPVGASAMASQSVRVRSQLLDRLISQSGEVLITRARMQARVDALRGALDDLTGNLDRLRHQLREIEVQAESQMQSRLAHVHSTGQTFDPLEFDRFTRVQELARMMAESVNDVATVQRGLQRTVEGAEDDLAAQARQARELQRDLLRTRMVAFDAIAERLYGVVRQTAKDLGRQVRLDISGGAVELDRGVLDRLAPAVEHLLRNAIVHGIEDAAARRDAGKPATGRIDIALLQEGNDIAIRVHDDGRGLDVARIRAKALALGLLPAEAALSVAEAADLVFLPGFTTAGQADGLSGRGIGMDVVRTEVQALSGHIETSSAAGQGTAFKIVLPLTTAVTQVVMLRAGPLSVGVPTNLVEAVRRVPAADLARAYDSETFEEAGEALPFYWAGALLQSSSASDVPADRHANVLILRSGSQRLALHVDAVLGKQEVVVKHLGPQLSRLPGLTGLSVLASGAVVLIYNPVALAAVHGAQARQAQRDRSLGPADAGPGLPRPAADTPLVLVVDDSITVRRVTQRLLQREGYRVALAADGAQALELLQGERPALVLSDIEMPRMDGFDLTRQIRADARLAALPIVMITSRMAEKHRELALGLGVNHYLGKPYSEDELLGLVRRYTPN